MWFSNKPSAFLCNSHGQRYRMAKKQVFGGQRTGVSRDPIGDSLRTRRTGKISSTRQIPAVDRPSALIPAKVPWCQLKIPLFTKIFLDTYSVPSLTKMNVSVFVLLNKFSFLSHFLFFSSTSSSNISPHLQLHMTRSIYSPYTNIHT